MEKKANQCFQCGETEESLLNNMFGYTICDPCKTKLGLFQDKTIKKYVSLFDKSKEADPDHLSYEGEVDFRLAYLEKDYIKKKIKLLHIKERLKYI